jgi:hypothetical protein
MIIVICSLSILMVDYLPKPENEIISILQFISIFMISFYLANRFGRARAKIILTNEGIIHAWIRRFFLSRERNIKIPWDIVDNYVFQKNRNFDSFIINLTNKTRYKINRLNFLPIKDDFKKLVKDFPRLSNEYINGIDSNLNPKRIKEGISMYASKSFRWAFYIMLVGFVFLLLFNVFNPDSGTNWSALGVIGCGILFYGFMIIGQKENN